MSGTLDLKADATWYRGGIVTANSVNGTMALEDQMFSFSDTTGKKIFELPVDKIKSFNISRATVGISPKEKIPYRLNFQFSSASKERFASNLMANGFLGLVFGAHSQKRSGLDNWISAFRSRGVQVNNYLRLLNIGITLTLVTFVVLMIYASTRH